MRDFLPADVRKRNYVIGIIKEVYESYGFEPLETPAVENIETLMGKYGEEGNQLIFKILKRGEKLRASQESGVGSREAETPALDSRLSTPDSLSDLALRYDLTVPLARVVAHHKNDLPKFFKRYQIQPVWRADRPARGRFREFYQCDVDAIGSKSMVVEAELISAASEILTRLGFKDFVIRANHRGVLRALLNKVNIPENQHNDALAAIDKLDKIGREKVTAEFIERGISSESCGKLFDLFEKASKIVFDKVKEGYNVNGEILLALSNFLESDKELNELRDLHDLTINRRLLIVPTLARGLSYYTGTIMEIDVGKEIGSLGGGGRYDGLIGMFGKEQIPACGFSLGLERILVVMDERNMFPPEIAASNSADVMVTIWNEDSIGESLKLANELRQQGLRVIVYPEADKIGKQLKYADTIGVPFACILGDEEREQGKIQLKDMNSGEKSLLAISEIAERIRAA